MFNQWLAPPRKEGTEKRKNDFQKNFSNLQLTLFITFSKLNKSFKFYKLISAGKMFFVDKSAWNASGMCPLPTMFSMEGFFQLADMLTTWTCLVR